MECQRRLLATVSSASEESSEVRHDQCSPLQLLTVKIDNQLIPPFEIALEDRFMVNFIASELSNMFLLYSKEFTIPIALV